MLESAALSTSRHERLGRYDWVLLASLYCAQYLGLSFFVVALVAILRNNGADMGTIGYIYLLGLVWPLKLLWAPLVDRVSFGRLGHFRGWLIIMQALLVAILAAMSTLSIDINFSLIYALCFAVAVFSATQDVALDGLACNLVPEVSRGVVNGIQISGGLIGNLVGGGVMLMLYPYIGWSGCLLVLAAVTAVPLGLLLGFHEARRPLCGRPSTIRIYGRIIGLWRGPPRQFDWLLLLIIAPLAGGMVYAVITPLLVDAGWSFEKIGLTVNIFGSCVGIASALGMGWLTNRMTRKGAFRIAALIQILGVLLVATFFFVGQASYMTSGILVFFLTYTPLQTIIATIMMDKTGHDNAATDYSVQFTVFQFTAIAAMFISAALANVFGFPTTVLLAGAAALLALGLVARWPAPEASGS